MFLGMKAPPLDSQDELLALRALVAEQAAKLSAQEAEVIKRDSIIGLLRAQLELLRHRQHGASSEKIDRKIEQFELMLEEIEASRAEADARSGKGLLPDLDDTPRQAETQASAGWSSNRRAGVHSALQLPDVWWQVLPEGGRQGGAGDGACAGFCEDRPAYREAHGL